jgi:DNA-binding transcriptional regulator YiaG
MPLDPSPMSPAEARDHLARLGVTQDRFAKIIRVNPSTFRRWIDPHSGFPMPRAVQLLLRALSAADMRRLIKTDDDASPA